MILVDTSVWIDHLRRGNSKLENLLSEFDVACHTFVMGELACGNLKNRKEIIQLLKALPLAPKINDDEILQFIDIHGLAGRGIGFIDVHLLASSILGGMRLWTLDRRLSEISNYLEIDLL